MKQLYQQSITVKRILLLISLFLGLEITAQTTSIPDQNFEQHLINEGIDSDGVINGQVLTSDINTVTVLILEYVEDVTGLEDFTALEFLGMWEVGQYTVSDFTLDLTSNVNLEKIEIWTYEGLKNINVTNLTNLEDLRIMEGQDDVVTMLIEEIDLSTNPNINYVATGYLEYLKEVNLKNGNNVNITDMEINLSSYAVFPICVKVDDATAAINNNTPYNDWAVYGFNPNYYDSGVCTLAAGVANKIKASLFPNPVQNVFQIKSSEEIERVNVFSIKGKEVASFGLQSTYDVSQLPTGVFFVKIQTNRGERVERIVKQ